MLLLAAAGSEEQSGMERRRVQPQPSLVFPGVFCGPNGDWCGQGLQAPGAAAEIKAPRHGQVEKRGREGSESLRCRAGGVTDLLFRS